MLQSDATVKDLMTKEVSTLGRNDTLDLADDLTPLASPFVVKHVVVGTSL